MNNEQLANLAEPLRRILLECVKEASLACKDGLVSVVLFGSAAEGRLRPVSDVNLLFVLKIFDSAQIDALRELLRTAQAAIQLKVMFLLEAEIPLASEAFATKFLDIQNRRCVLYGSDPFAVLKLSREATLQRILQVVMNQILRLRERYALLSLREEQLVPVIANVAGVLRTTAEAILELEGAPKMPPREALQAFVKKLPGGEWDGILANMSRAREDRRLPAGEGKRTVLGILRILEAMQTRAQGLR